MATATEPRWQAQADIPVCYHSFYLADIGIAGPELPMTDIYGLIVSQRGIVVIMTGIHTGNVTLTLELHDQAPPVQTADWDEVVETPLESLRGQMVLSAPTVTSPEDLPVLALDGPGDYRVRAHARGRDTAVDLSIAEAVEHYRIQIWAAPSTPQIIHKQTDNFGANRRLAQEKRNERVRRRPPNPPPQVPPQRR